MPRMRMAWSSWNYVKWKAYDEKGVEKDIYPRKSRSGSLPIPSSSPVHGFETGHVCDASYPWFHRGFNLNRPLPPQRLPVEKHGYIFVTLNPPPPPGTSDSMATTPTYTQCNPLTQYAPSAASRSLMPARQREVDTVRSWARGSATGSTNTNTGLQPVSALQRRFPESHCRSGLPTPARSAVCCARAWWPRCLTCSMPCSPMLSLSPGAFCSLWSGRYVRR